MGAILLEILQTREERQAERRQRLENIKSAQVTNPKPATPSSTTSSSSSSSRIEGHNQATNNSIEYMDVEMYKAAASDKDDTNSFSSILQRVSARKGYTQSDILGQVSPSGNTLLHVAASHDNHKIMMQITSVCPLMIMKQNSKDDTALHVTCRSRGHFHSDTFLLDLIEPIEDTDLLILLTMTNKKGNTALHEAVITGTEFFASELMKIDPELSYVLNKKGESPLYLAARAGYKEIVSFMLRKVKNKDECLKGKSPLQAAIKMRDKGLIDIILEAEPRFINLLDEERMSPLHFAASINYVEGVRYLLSKGASSPTERSLNGLLPIHLAAIKGHIQATQELLHHYPDTREMLNHNGQNILHAAAKSGKYNFVKYILKTPELEYLINEEDCDGNTPLHLATINWHPKTVNTMTWDQRVNLNVENNEGLTAIDVAEYNMKGVPAFRKCLTWTALKAAGAAQTPRIEAARANMEDTNQPELSNADSYKERVNTLLLVATLVATVTFAAGFTMPGGYNNSNPDQGMATMLRDNVFPVFALCDTIAMCSSVIVVVTLIWAQLGDVNLAFNALRLALPLLGVSLTMMSLAFMAGLYLVVRKLTWLAYAIFIMGVVFLIVLLIWFFPLCFPVTSSNHFLRYISYYPFQLLIFLASGNQGTS